MKKLSPPSIRRKPFIKPDDIPVRIRTLLCATIAPGSAFTDSPASSSTVIIEYAGANSTLCFISQLLLNLVSQLPKITLRIPALPRLTTTCHH